MHAPKSTTWRIPIPKVSLGIYGRLILLLLVVLIPILLIQTLIYYERLQTRKATELQANLEVARAVGRAFGAFLEDVLHHEYAIGIAATGSSPLSNDDLKRLLEAGATDHHAIRSLDWVGPDGRVLNASNPNAKGLDISDRPYFQEIVSGSDWSVSDLVLSKVDGQPRFTICRGVRDHKGDLLGVVVAAITPDRLDSVLAIERPDEGGVSLMDSKGMLVYRFPHIQVSWEERKWAEIFPLSVSAALKGKEAKEIVPTTPYDRKSRMVAAAPIPSIGWVAGAGRREEDAMRAITSTLIRDGSLFLSIVLGSFLAALFVSRTIAAPIKALQKDAYRFRQGMLDSPIEPTGPWEARQLAISLNQMAAEIRHWVEETSAQAQRAEERAREAEEGRRLLHALMEHVPEGITIADAPDVTIRMVSKHGQELVGQPTEIIEGIPLGEHSQKWALFHPDGITPVRDEELPLTRATLHGEVVRDEEWVIKRPDGSVITILCNAGPIWDKGGDITAGVIAWRDVTERKHLEEELRELSERLSYHVENSPLAVIEWGADMRLIRWSGTAERIFGWRAEEVIGKRIEDFRWVYEEDEAQVTKVSSELETGANPQRFSANRNYRKDGSVVQCEWYSSSLVDASGKLRSILSLVLDVTERKRLEEKLREARDQLELRVRERTSELSLANRALREYTGKLERLNKELEEFSWIAAHDLQEPLRKIQAFGSRLERIKSALSNEVQNDIHRMIQSANHMASLIKALKNYSEATRGMGSFELTDLSKVVEETATDMELAIRETGGQVEIVELPSIEVDKAGMRCLFQNLISNSLKYIKVDEKPMVRITGQVVDGMCRIEVQDNGIGFKDQYKEKIFTPFQRLYGPKSPYGGTGMGLAICRKIVEMHGGSITARSTPGHGATFIISLPCRQRKG